MVIDKRYYDAMKSKGFSYNTTASLKKFKCPNCGFEFTMIYGRTFACQGCSEAQKDCPKLRCEKCDEEFFIKETPQIDNDYQQKMMAEHICRIVTKYHDDLGNKPNR